MLDKIRRGFCLLTAVSLLSGAVAAAESVSAAEIQGAAEEELPHEGYIVKLADTARLQGASGKSLLRSGFFSRLKNIHGALYHVDDRSTLDQLTRSGVVEYAEPNYILTLGELPDDEYLVSGDEWYYKTLGVDTCRDHDVTGQGVRVGIIDSGLNADHEDFAQTKIIPGTNYTAAKSSTARTDTSDDNGHGTVVAGLIAATVGNGKGIAGVAPDAEIVSLKAFKGSSGTGSVENIVDAIYGGVDDYQCKVLNMSLGMEKESAMLREAVRYAHEKGVIVVSAAGNRTKVAARTGDDPPYYPASWPEVVGVGAVDRKLQSPWYSFWNESVWIVAPGSGIYGPSNQSTSGYKTNAQGTSYAAPLVSAAAALALSVRPALTPDEFSALLRDTARDLGEPGYDKAAGHGLLNAGLMAAALRGDVAWQAVSHTAEYTKGERLLLAGYSAEGSLICVHSATSAAPLPEAARWRLYVLDEVTLAPVREPYTLSSAPWTMAEENTKENTEENAEENTEANAPSLMSVEEKAEQNTEIEQVVKAAGQAA